MSQLKKEKGALYVKDNTDRWRLMGTVDDEAKTLNIIRYKDKHLHRNTNSYGINKAIVNEGWFEYIILNEVTKTATNIYVIPIEELKLQPAYKAAEFEVQLMIDLDTLHQWKV